MLRATRLLQLSSTTRGRIVSRVTSQAWQHPQLAQLRRMAAASASGAADAAARPAPPFASAGELAAWLEAHGVPVAKYGRGTAKSVADLFEEVAAGESTLSLAGGTPQRQLAVVTLLVTNAAGQVLLEAKQQLPDGRTRERRLPLSEKLVGAEDWRAAAARGVGEELGSALPAGCQQQFKLDEASYALTTKLMASPSYPGLPTRYTLHRAAATVPGLPAGPFHTREQRPGGGQLVTWWEWVARDEVDALETVS